MGSPSLVTIILQWTFLKTKLQFFTLLDVNLETHVDPLNWLSMLYPVVLLWNGPYVNPETSFQNYDGTHNEKAQVIELPPSVDVKK